MRRVHVKNGRYYYVHRNRWTALSRVEEGQQALDEALARLPLAGAPTTIHELLIAYQRHGMAELRPATAREYRRILSGRLAHHFGHMAPQALLPRHVAQYLELRKDDGHGTMGNRERAVLSSVYEFALRRGWVDTNPCRGIRRNKERPSQRLVTDAELREAMDRAPEHFALALGIAYLTGLRMSDLLELRREQLREDGIHVTESKTGKRNVIAWSPALRELVRRALERSKGSHVLTGRYGRPVTASSLASNMKRLKVDWTFRDLRPKAASDADHDVIGHRGQMLGRYQRARRLKPVR